ncbi:unnamed protein product [Lasius platythorax]|uniref:Uncharacterized protein n=1 Tax=Lasius platythorax TaxID=488582 RepID=A0AAV2NPW4_9HYME
MPLRKRLLDAGRRTASLGEGWSRVKGKRVGLVVTPAGGYNVVVGRNEAIGETVNQDPAPFQVARSTAEFRVL